LQARRWSVVAGGPHPAPGALSFLPGVERYEVLKTLEGAFDVAVLTDCPNPDRTEGLIDAAKRTAPVVVNIDHHPDNRRYGTVNWIDVGAAATGEMVYRLLTALRASLTPAIATNLFTAVHTDTGSFRYSNVTPRTFMIAAALVAGGARPELVSQSLYERRAPDALHWLGEALSRVEVSEDGQLGWLALPSGAVPERVVESEELVNYPRSIATVRVACLLRERDGQVKVSLRGERRIGHAGTLDPDATGVLPVLVGEATKLTPYLVDHEKEYLATVRFGLTTDTHDVSGRVLSETPVGEIARDRLADVCRGLVGRIKQVPPMYSAVHHEGRRLYELARAGIEVARAPREVFV